MPAIQDSDAGSCAFQGQNPEGFTEKPSVLKSVQAWGSHSKEADFQLLYKDFDAATEQSVFLFQP